MSDFCLKLVLHPLPLVALAHMRPHPFWRRQNDGLGPFRRKADGGRI